MTTATNVKRKKRKLGRQHNRFIAARDAFCSSACTEGVLSMPENEQLEAVAALVEVIADGYRLSPNASIRLHEFAEAFVKPVRVHTPERRIICPVCRVVVRREGRAVQHGIIVHEGCLSLWKLMQEQR